MALIVLYPEALNQHSGDAIDVLWLFLFSIPLGLFAYPIALLTLLVGTLIKRRRTSLERQSLQIVARSAIPIGAAFTLFGPIMFMSQIVGETLAFSLELVTLIAGIVFAWFTFRRSRLLNVSCLFPDSWWVLILTIPLLIAMVASISSAHQNAGIAGREMKSEGVIEDCQPNNLCRFTFAFRGRTFKGAGTPSTGSGAVGNQVTVFFDTNHPQTSSLEDFERISRRQLIMVPLCLIAICALAGVVVYAGRRQSRTANHLLNA